MLYVHVLPAAPLGTGHMAEPGTGQHEGGITVRKTAHHVRSATDFPVKPFYDIVGTDANPVFTHIKGRPS